MKLLSFLVFLACAVSCTPSRETTRPVATTAVHPQADAETRDIAEREVVRREGALRDAQALLEDGKRKAAEGQLDEAVRTFRQSIETHP